MPTERFLNLPKEKRARILSAAKEELARVPLAQFSINQVVQQAGIPRGSFYQYFAGKEDLLDYLMQEYTCGMRRFICEVVQSGGDMFLVFAKALEYVVQYGRQPGNLPLCRSIFSQISFCGDEPGLALGIRFGEYQQWGEDMKKRLYTGLPPQDAQPVFDMLQILLRHTVGQMFRDGDFDAAQKQYAQQAELIKRGVLAGNSKMEREEL